MRKRKALTALILAIVLIMSASLVWAEDPAPAEGSGEETTGESSGSDTETGTGENTVDPAAGPAISAGSALIYCRNTGSVLFSKAADVRMSPYSITKLMTALLAVQRLPLDREITVSEEDASAGGSTMELKAGEIVTVEELLYGTLVLSGNDAALTLGKAVSGDTETFVGLMNDTAANIGLNNTHFANPSGLIDDVSKHYTTANDMLEIAKLAFANEIILKIAGTEKYEMPATNLSGPRTMENHNDLLTEGREGYVAGKTGYWADDKCTLVMDYRADSLEFITVILGANIKTRSADCDALTDYAADNLRGIVAIEAGKDVGMVRVRHGERTRVAAYTASDAVIYMPREGSRELISTEAVMDDDVAAPLSKGDVVGKYRIYVAGELVDEIDLVSHEDVPVGWFPSYIGIPNRAALIIAGAAALILLIVIIRTVNRIKAKRARRKAHRELVRAMARRELERERKRVGRVH